MEFPVLEMEIVCWKSEELCVPFKAIRSVSRCVFISKYYVIHFYRNVLKVGTHMTRTSFEVFQQWTEVIQILNVFVLHLGATSETIPGHFIYIYLLWKIACESSSVVISKLVFSWFLFSIAKMVMPANRPRIVKKRKKRFIRHQSDRYLRVKVGLSFASCFYKITWSRGN